MSSHTFTIVDETKHLVTHRGVDSGGLRFVRSNWAPGYSFTTVYHTACAVKDMTSKHVIVSGRIVTSGGTLPDRSIGWNSYADPSIIPAGTYMRSAPEGGEIWCVRTLDPVNTDISHLRVVNLNSGDTLSIAVGEYFLVAEGMGVAGDIPIEAEKPYLVGSSGKVLTALGSCYVFVWAPGGE